MQIIAGALGFEPRLTVPETVVLPLYYAPVDEVVRKYIILPLNIIV